MANGKKHKAAGATLQKAQPCFHGPNAASNHGQASTVYYTVYSKNKEIKIYTEKISTKMVIGYTDGYTARIFCILDFSDKFRYIRYTEKSFENNVSHCYGLFDSTGS